MKIKLLKKSFLFVVALMLSTISIAETVWIDVRSALEHKVDNIEGDIRIPHSEIVKEVIALYPDKGTEINLYCRSGGRAGKAMKALEDAGYNKVKNTGGIDDARKLRGLSE